MKKLLIIAICLFGLSPFLKAQMLNLNYQISLPMNQVKDFTDKASFRGFDIEYHQFLGDQFSIGAAIGWDVFYKDKKHTPGNFRFNGNEQCVYDHRKSVSLHQYGAYVSYRALLFYR